MIFTAIDILSVPDGAQLWRRLVDASVDGWLWHTWAAHEFNLEAGARYGARDLSFFVYDGTRAAGVVPLIVEERNGQRQAAYYSGFLPWPCFAGTVLEREAFEDFAFMELERRARAAGATHIVIHLIPPQDAGDEKQRTARVAANFGYVQHSFDSHIAVLDAEWRFRIRERYRRYVKKFSPLFTLTIAEGVEVTSELEEAYFRLHIADAGKQVRSRESYARQADFARRGEGFYVVATHIESGAIAGALLISLYKGVAFDNSVGIAPAYADLYVGHLLRFAAMEELERRGIGIYELPLKVRKDKNTSQKEQGISHFKEGWTGGGMRTLWGLEKDL